MSGFVCPDCRSVLTRETATSLVDLVCPGCAARYWLRGAQVVRVGEHEALEQPDTQVPAARARIRKRDDERDK